MKSDRHIHTPYCPHGTEDKFEAYIEKALDIGLKEITFTEHAPLPRGFIDPAPDKDSGMDPALLLDYFHELAALKKQYAGELRINSGLEIDFIEGYEQELTEFLDEFGPFLDDAILSVHFLKHQEDYYCLDFSPEEFNRIVHVFGSVDEVYKKYYETLSLSVLAGLGRYKPRRIGHITLVHKFQHQFPHQSDYDPLVYGILEDMSRCGLELDYNAAGLYKPLCMEPYPPDRFIRKASELGIPLITGSDAHQASDVGRGFTELFSVSEL